MIESKRSVLFVATLLTVLFFCGCSDTGIDPSAPSDAHRRASVSPEVSASLFATLPTGDPWIGPSAPLKDPLAQADYILIATSEMEKALDSLIEHRRDEGFRILVGDLDTIEQTYEAASREDKIRAYLQTTVDPNRMTFVLLAGTNLTIPMPFFDIGSGYDCHSDVFYANLHSDFDSSGDGRLAQWGVDDYDLVFDVHVGRLPIDDPDRAKQWAAQTVAFENGRESFKQNALLAAGYISTPGDAALGQQLVRNLVLQPAGYDVVSMYEAVSDPSVLDEFETYAELTHAKFLDRLVNQDHGLVFWMSHGNVTGAYLLHGGAFVRVQDADALAEASPAMYFSSGCLNSYPQEPFPDPEAISLGQALIGSPAVSFVGSTALTNPGALYEGVLILMTAMDRVAVKRHALAVAVDEARTVYYDHFWDLPYPKEVFLQNFFGFTVYGDPGLRYPDVVDGKYAG